MSTQKEAVLRMVEEQRQQGRGMGEILVTLGIKRSSYYRWKKGEAQPCFSSRKSFPLTPEEHRWIEEVKETHPEYRHRRLQGALQAEGNYVSASAIYTYLKIRGQVERYARREHSGKLHGTRSGGRIYYGDVIGPR